jgi:FixJ family two-component response regulator
VRDAIVDVIDDDLSILASLSSLLRASGLRVRTFDSAQKYLSNLPEQTVPCCVLLDYQLPGMNGLELQSYLSTARAEAAIIFLTGEGDIPTSVRAVKAGAVEFLTKPVKAEDLLAAIRQGISDSESRLIQTRKQNDIRSRFEALTEREREVVRLVAQGLLNKQIAGELGIAEITVKLHRGRAFKKLGVRSVAALVRLLQ